MSTTTGNPQQSSQKYLMEKAGEVLGANTQGIAPKKLPVNIFSRRSSPGGSFGRDSETALSVRIIILLLLLGGTDRGSAKGDAGGGQNIPPPRATPGSGSEGRNYEEIRTRFTRQKRVAIPLGARKKEGMNSNRSRGSGRGVQPS